MSKKWIKGLSIPFLLVLLVALSGCSCMKGKPTSAAETVTAPPAVVEQSILSRGNVLGISSLIERSASRRCPYADLL